MPTGTAQIAAMPLGKKLTLESHLMLVAAAILLVSAVLWADRPPTMEKTDFSVTYIGSRMVYLGLGSKLYDLAEQKALKKTLLPDAEALIYEHPPFEALLLAPLGALPYRTAYLLWGLLNAAIWLALPYLLRPCFPVPRDDLGYLALWLIFAPLGVTLFQGQSSLLVLLVYALAFTELKDGRDFRAGMVFGLALFKFQFAIPFALIFLLRRQWRFVKGFFTTAAMLGALSLLAVGWQGIVSYIRLLMGIGSHPDNLSYGAAVDMATVQGFVHALLGHYLGRTGISMVVAAVSLLLIFWTAWTWKPCPRSEAGFDLMFAAAITVSLVTGFHMFTHDLSPLILAMFIVCAHFPRPGDIVLRLLLGTTLTLLWTPPVFFGLIAWHRLYLWFPVLLIFLFGVLRRAKEMRLEPGLGNSRFV